jgi:hypothetical protein
MEEAPENGKESSHSAHANGIEQNLYMLRALFAHLQEALHKQLVYRAEFHSNPGSSHPT